MSEKNDNDAKRPPTHQVVSTPDGEKLIPVDSPDTPWDRDVRAFFEALTALAASPGQLERRMVDAVTAADIAENARNARDIQRKLGIHVGRCIHYVPESPRTINSGARCAFLNGHEGEHSFG